MADNVSLNAGSGGDTIAADDVAGVKYQVVKIDVGGDGAAAPLSNANPIPISDAGGTVTVDGTVELGATTLAALESTTIVDGGGSITVDGTVAATQSGTWNVGTVTSVTNAVTVVGSAAEDAAAAGNPVLVGGRYDSSARTLETGDAGALAVNASGQLLVEIAAGAGSGGTAAADDADFTAGTTSGTPVMGSYQSSPTAVTDGDMGVIGITSSREVKVSVTSGGIAGKAEDAAHTTGDEGVVILAVRRDTAAVGSGTDGDYSTINVDSAGRLYSTVGVNASSGGQSAFRSLDVDESEDEVKASAGKLFWLHAMNLTAAVVYLKIYNNTAAGTTVGTTTPVFTFPIPTLGDTNGAGFTIHFGDTGVAFSTGICVAGLTGIADNDTTGVGANGLVVNAGYA